MSNEIMNWSVIDYKSTVDHLLQQKGSKFRMCVMEESFQGKSGVPINQVGAVTAQLSQAPQKPAKTAAHLLLSQQHRLPQQPLVA